MCSTKVIFSKKATKIEKIFTVFLTLCSKCQIDGEDFVIFVAFLENMNFTKKDTTICISYKIINFRAAHLEAIYIFNKRKN